MKINLFCRYLLVAASAAQIGLVKHDNTGLTHSFGLFNVQSITRIAVFAVIGFLFVSLVLLRAPKISGPQATTNNFWVIVLLSYYSIFFVFSAGVLPLKGLAIAGYRVGEWILVILLCSYYYDTFRASHGRVGSLSDEFISCMRIFTSIQPLVVLIGLILVPDLAYSISEKGVFRFGGFLYGPNSLGVLCGIGSVLFWILPRRPMDRLWSIALFAFMILTYSRGAMVGFAVYILYYNLLFSPLVRKIVVSFFLLLFFLVVSISDSEKDLFFGTFSWFSRGESAESVASLNARTIVWETSLKAISDSPWVGHGFIQGPKKIMDNFEQKWWAPPNAHNDIINSGVAGGWGLAAFTLYIYIMATFKWFRLKMPTKIKAVTGAILIQCGLYSIITPVFSSYASSIGIIMVILIGYLFTQSSLPETNIRLHSSHAHYFSP